MSFREKSAAVVVATLIVVYGGYFAWAFTGPRPQDDTVGALVTAALLVILVTIVSHVALAIGYRREAREGRDERDTLIGWRAGRNAYYVLMAGVWVIPTLAVMHAGKGAYANAFVALLMASEIANYGSRIYYYRTGV